MTGNSLINALVDLSVRRADRGETLSMIPANVGKALFARGKPLGSGAFGQTRTTKMARRLVVVKRFHDKRDASHEQRMHARVYKRMAKYPELRARHMTKPIYAEPPYGIQTLVSGTRTQQVKDLHAALIAGSLTPAQWLDVGGQLARFLAALHRVGVVHSDIGAPNLMVVYTKGGDAARLVVIDFGLAASTAKPRKLSRQDIRRMNRESIKKWTSLEYDKFARADIWWTTRKSATASAKSMRFSDEVGLLKTKMEWEARQLPIYEALIRKWPSSSRSAS